MCLGIPVPLISIDGQTAVADIGGTRKTIDLRLLPEAQVGDYVILHAGFAMQRIDPEEARTTFEMIQRWDEAQRDNASWE